MSEEEMAAQIVTAVETGFPGDRAMQIKQVALAARTMPISFTKVFLLALRTLSADLDATEGE
jgi:hypothetical protein